MLADAPAGERLSSSLPGPWLAALDAEARESLERAETYVAAREAAGAIVYPPAPLRYRALELVSPKNVRVVILGQDPYHRRGQAMGLSFSVPRGVNPPASLKNVFKELETDLGIAPSAHGDLTSWAEQGVLLLNASLTVEEGQPNRHRNIGWHQVTDALIQCASDEAKAAVFMLWGIPARSKAPLVDHSRHLVLEAAHPSPLARKKFFGCRHFSKANDFLRARGMGAVGWKLPCA